jgi:hypothetical protein
MQAEARRIAPAARERSHVPLSMETAMKKIGLAALGLSLVTATAAFAQTTVTREISDMPVETTIVRSPSGTTVTRRVLPTTGTERVIVTPVEPSSRTVTVREPRAPRATTRVVTSQRRAPVYAMATAEPIALGRAERDVVYRQIVEQRSVPVEQRGILAPIGSMFPTVAAAPAVTYSRPLVADPALRTSYVVGTRLPTDVQLIELPETAIAQVPAIAPYAYAMIDGRVLLVDPQTGMIVADITN